MKTITLSVSLLFLSTGCVSMSSLQSARPHKPGTYSTSFGIGYESLKFKNTSDDDDSGMKDAVEDIKVPIIEAGGRYGIVDNLDVGGKYTVPGTMSADVKYMLIGKGSSFAASVGVGAGYGSVEFGSGDSVSKTTLIDLFLPIYLSYDVTKSFGLHLTPKFLKRNSTTTDPDNKSTSSSSNIVGSAAGLNLGWFFAEYAYFVNPDDDSAGIQQVMIGFNDEGEFLTR